LLLQWTGASSLLSGARSAKANFSFYIDKDGEMNVEPATAVTGLPEPGAARMANQAAMAMEFLFLALDKQSLRYFATVRLVSLSGCLSGNQGNALEK
jgi:hypothetical protein